MGFREYRVDYTDELGNTTTLSGVSNVRVTLKKDAASNSAEITLSNYGQRYVSEGEIIFKEGESLNIYAVEGKINVNDASHLIGTFVILDTELYPDDRKAKIICTDNTYNMLASLYTADETDTIDNIVFNIVQTTAQNGDTQNAITTNISALTSTGDPLPTENFTSVWKTAYEAINELSQTDYTGDDRAYIFWFDSDGTFNWVYPSQTPETTSFIYEGENVITQKFSKSESETVNMLIYDAGEDKNGSSILDFVYRPDAGSIKGSIKYQPMTEIRDEVKNTLGQTAYDAISNDDFVALCKAKANPKSQAIISKIGDGVWECEIMTWGTKYVAGSLYTVQSTRIGFPTNNLRIDTVIHTMNVNGWSTKLTLSEDVSATE